MTTNDYEVLKQLTARALIEFEGNKSRYEECIKELTKEEAKCRKIEAQFKQLKQVSLLAVAEYESLHKQYVAESKYREQVEEKLKKVVEENSEIRKQNNLGANVTIIPGNGGAAGTKGELEVLRSMKDAINAELRNTKNELSRTKEMLEQEKAAHEMSLKRLDTGIKQINQLKRVSVLAMDEFSVLRRKFEIESTCRRKAEDVATELVGKQELTETKRRISNEEEDKQLKTFMEEIEKINAKAEQERKKNEEKIRDLEEQLAESQNAGNIKVMEEKLLLVLEQLELSQKSLVEAEERASKAESESRNLYSRLALAEREIESGRSLPSPPPPPPPPPPPMAAPIIRKFIMKIGRKNKPGVAAGPEDDKMATAMADMIARIKKGVKLRHVESASDLKGEDENKGAMGELAGLLTNLRQNRQESVDVAGDEATEPEFTRLKLKKLSSLKTSTSVEENETVNELKRKLEKQKTLADGIKEDREQTESDVDALVSEQSTREEQTVKDLSDVTAGKVDKCLTDTNGLSMK